MGVTETVAGLTRFQGRGAGSDGERRAALWLTQEVETARRPATLETFWCRPNWALATAWHVGLAVAGSLVSVSSAWLGGALVLAALMFVAVDVVLGRSPGRRLTPERASQNVVSRPAEPGDRVHLIVTANYDAGRTGLVFRAAPRRLASHLRRLAGPAIPGWLGWIGLAMMWLIAVAILRAGGASGTAIGIVQLIPTAGLVLTLALLLELASAEFGPAANDNASGVALALGVVRALDVAPPPRLSVELVLQGAGDGTMTGLTRHLRGRRKELRRANAIVLGIAPSGGGNPAWWVSDGPLVPLRYLRRLAAIAERLGGPQTEHGAKPHRGRGTTPAFPARLAGLPAITIGCLDGNGLAPRSHRRTDAREALDGDAMDKLLAFALTLVDAIDDDLRTLATPSAGEAAAKAGTTS